jgi:hypothetical protein
LASEDIAVSGPGQYLPDPTEGITNPADLPQAKIVRRSRHFTHRPWPRWGKSCFRQTVSTRVLHDGGDLVVGRPRDIPLEYSQHRCTRCQKFFNADTSAYALPRSRSTHRVVSLALRLVVADGLPYQAARWHLWRDHRVFVPFATIQNWVEAGGKKAARQMGTSPLDWGLADFSGYIAADELYDGPFCVLSIVDNRTFKRLLYQVLDHDPDHRDITAFFHRFRMALRLRGRKRQGVTTDASPLYAEPLQEVFGNVPHQICAFPAIKELTQAIGRAVAQVRKKLAAPKPAGQRGRPTTTAAKRVARCRQRLQQKSADRFDRRCRTDTALAKVATLRQRVRRFTQVGKVLNKLPSPNRDKALTFLDDKLLPSTSNAVERGNRRHRKMQTRVYRVRTKEHIHNRIALDMLRESQKEDRDTTTKVLHRVRAG